MNIIFISPNYPAGHWRYVTALREAGHNILGIGDAGDETFPPVLRGSLTEYYRVGDLHDYDAVYRACGYFISRYGRIDAIESLNDYWRDLLDALCGDSLLCASSPEESYALEMDVRLSRMDFLPPHLIPATQREAVDFAAKYGYPLTALPTSDKRLGRQSPDSDKKLRELIKNSPKKEYVLYAPCPGDKISIDGLCMFAGRQDDDGFPELSAVAIAAHAMREDGCAVGVELSEDEVRYIEGIVTRCGEAGFFHLDAVRATKAVPDIAKRGELVICDFTPTPPHEYIIDCINLEIGADLRALWTSGFAPTAAPQAEADTDTETGDTDTAITDGGETPSYPLERKCLAAAVSRSFDRSYKNSHEAVMRKLSIALSS
ncbi:MAG: hypothetical protein IJC18_02345, partial [Clostridia bacterium]|nr:hypothetical protein [Clostridia bacterium]